MHNPGRRNDSCRSCLSGDELRRRQGRFRTVAPSQRARMRAVGCAPRAQRAVMVLTALHLVALAHADIIPQQIPGEYKLIPRATGGTACLPGLSFGQVEVVSTHQGTLFVVPDQNITVTNRFPGDPGAQCASSPVTGTDGVSVSSTVLRPMNQVTPDRNVDILNQFYASGETFYIGYEVGDRVCGGQTLPSGTVSLWAVPKQDIRATDQGVVVTFKANNKYLYYFSAGQPCLYTGNPGSRGTVLTPAPTPKPSDGSVEAAPAVGPSGGARKHACDPCPASTSPVPRSGSSASGPGTKPGASSSGSKSQDNAECFPGSAMVTLKSGQNIRMAQAKIGDEVLVGRESGSGRHVYSPIILFSHADPGAVSRLPLVVLTTELNRTIALTAGHMVYSNGELRAASSVGVGDFLLDGTVGVSVRVMRRERRFPEVRRESKRASDGPWTGGLYNPQTMHGDIVVDGVVASCYTAAVEPWLAHALLAVPRMLYRYFGVTVRQRTATQLFGLFQSEEAALPFAAMLLDVVGVSM